MITLKFTGSHDEIVNDIKHMLDVLEGRVTKYGGFINLADCELKPMDEVKPAERPASVAEDVPSPAVEPAEAPVADAKEEPTPEPEPATAPATAAQATPTAAECKAKLIELRNKAGSKAVRELLKAHGAMTVPELKPEDYAAIMAEAEEALANAN